MKESVIRDLVIKNDTKMLLIVLDGLGGLAVNKKTELETAVTPNMDRLACENETGLLIPVNIGITPGSGPGHLGVFGYEPTDHIIGRGVLEALGIDLELDRGTVTARCNFCSVDRSGNITDRRAGRIPTEENVRLCAKLSENIKTVDNHNIEFYSGKEHRFVFVIRGLEGKADVHDTDPQITGVPPRKAEPEDGESALCADIINKAFKEICTVLKSEKANSVLFRGIGKMPEIETLEERFMLKTACIATYPMYRGLARLVGMDILNTGDSISDEIDVLENNYGKYDYFFLHVKKTDSYGEDGNFAAKVKVIEEFDALMPRIEKMGFNVIAVTGDHSTPAKLKAHSYHPVPLLLIHSDARLGDTAAFSERECTKGALGMMKSKYLINLMLAACSRLQKFGA